jgi:choline kinase
MNRSEIKAIMLVAGEGTRLRPYTNDRPKCMVEVDGESLLDRQMAVLHSESLDNIVLVGGYRADMLENRGTKLVLNPRYFETNMVWTLFCAEEELEGDVLICYGDIVYSKEILSALLASPADIALTIDMQWESYWRARNENPLDDAETLKWSSDGQIAEIGKKPTSLEEIQGQYMGLLKFSAVGIDKLRQVFHQACAEGGIQGKSPEKAYMTDLIQEVIDRGVPVHGVPIDKEWVEVDTVGDLQSSVTIARLHAIAQGLL